MGKRFIWTEEEILKWINNNDLKGFVFVRIIEFKGLYSRLLFICPKCNKEYKVCFKNFKNGQRCGCENGKRNHTYQDMIDETNKRNYKILNDDKTYSYEKKFKLMCDNNHIFYMRLTDLIRGHGCPHCSRNAKLTYEYIVKYFYSYGYEILSKEYINAHSKLLVKCPKGHEYEVSYADFYSGKRCPYCNESKGEKEIIELLNKYNIQYNTQYRFDDCKFYKTLPFDFYLPQYNILIEYDGRQHFEIVEQFGGLDGFIDTKIRDTVKTIYCKNNNIKLIRIPYWEFKNIEEILIKELNLNKYE